MIAANTLDRLAHRLTKRRMRRLKRNGQNVTYKYQDIQSDYQLRLLASARRRRLRSSYQDAKISTDAKPGTIAKVDVMATRASFGLPLFMPDDEDGFPTPAELVASRSNLVAFLSGRRKPIDNRNDMYNDEPYWGTEFAEEF